MKKNWYNDIRYRLLLEDETESSKNMSYEDLHKFISRVYNSKKNIVILKNLYDLEVFEESRYYFNDNAENVNRGNGTYESDSDGFKAGQWYRDNYFISGEVFNNNTLKFIYSTSEAKDDPYTIYFRFIELLDIEQYKDIEIDYNNLDELLPDDVLNKFAANKGENLLSFLKTLAETPDKYIFLCGRPHPARVEFIRMTNNSFYPPGVEYPITTSQDLDFNTSTISSGVKSLWIKTNRDVIRLYKYKLLQLNEID